MAAKVNLEALRDSGEITESQYQTRLRQREYDAQYRLTAGGSARSIGGGVKSAASKVVRIPEADLLSYASDLQNVAASITAGQASDVSADVLARIATTLEAMVNPLRARLPELEAEYLRLEIAFAEATLEFTKADAAHMLEKRKSGPESKDAVALGKLAAVASTTADALQKERNAAKAEWMKATRA